MATWACRLGSGGEFDVSPDSYDVVWWEWKTTQTEFPRPSAPRGAGGESPRRSFTRFMSN